MKLRAVILFAIASLALILSVYFGSSYIASRREAVVSQKWQKVIAPTEKIPSLFPLTKKNQSAQKLERIVRNLGIDLVPKSTANGMRPDARATEEFKKVKDNLGSFLTSQINGVGHTNQEPSPSVRDYMRSHNQEIREVVAHLYDDEIPYWDCDIKQLFRAPLPNLLGISNLHKVLSVHVLLSRESGDHLEAQRAMGACFKLAQSLLRRPEEISQLIAWMILRTEAGVARLSDAVPSGWTEILRPSNLLSFYFSSELAHIWVWQEEARKGTLLNELDGRSDESENFISRSQDRWMVAEFSERTEEAIHDLKNRSFCSPKRVLSYEEIRRMFSKWNSLAIGYTDPAYAWNKLARTLFDLELTQVILQTHKLHSKANLDFASSICPREHWKYHVQNGMATLSFSKIIDWSQEERPEGASDCKCEDASKKESGLSITHTDQIDK